MKVYKGFTKDLFPVFSSTLRKPLFYRNQFPSPYFHYDVEPLTSSFLVPSAFTSSLLFSPTFLLLFYCFLSEGILSSILFFFFSFLASLPSFSSFFPSHVPSPLFFHPLPLPPTPSPNSFLPEYSLFCFLYILSHWSLFFLTYLALKKKSILSDYFPVFLCSQSYAGLRYYIRCLREHSSLPEVTECPSSKDIDQQVVPTTY